MPWPLALRRAERRGDRQEQTHDPTDAAATLLPSLGEQMGSRKATAASRDPCAGIFGSAAWPHLAAEDPVVRDAQLRPEEEGGP